ncbi:MAG: ATP-grasp domain-containing protein [Thermoflexaceae bacterium]|nr:ATP-grasp domain-containing protein [Thermoflexaceae bacterium]
MKRISRLLVANRGEITRRIMRTAREMGIETVAIYADPDSHAPFVHEADEAIALGGSTAAETYLDVARVIDAARRSGADAIHPGYGFLSENAGFARAVVEAGLTWVGPSPEAIAAMGDKLAAKRLMMAAGVPTLPSTEVPADGRADLQAIAAPIGLPVLVKAAAGGGGKGMRIVRSTAELAEAVAGAQREALGAFGNGTVFLERYLEAPRHVEIQVLGDSHGNLIHCFERECSIQRRHQKIIEEAPSPAMTPELREQMGLAAVTAAQAIGYTSAGTVEFLLDTNGQFYFLEVNTRLQVEHPVTEAITGLDLVREQIRIAQGERLDVHQGDLAIRGHAIEARLYAEDPANGFLPATGTVLAWEEPKDSPARFDSGVETGSDVSLHFDPMLAKVIVHAPNRTEAALRLARVLERTRIHGVTTNRDFLVATLRHPAFLAGDTTTAFIEKHDPARVRRPAENEVRAAALAVALKSQDERRRGASLMRTLPSGWRNNPSQMQQTVFTHQGEEVKTGYLAQRDGSFDYEVAGVRGSARLHRADGDLVDVEIDGSRRVLAVAQRGSQFWVQGASGEVQLTELPRFPDSEQEEVAGGYAAPMPGKIVSIHVEPGDAVTRGQLLMVMEAMKMEHRITCVEESAKVTEVRVAKGDQVEAGQMLVVVEGSG